MYGPVLSALRASVNMNINDASKFTGCRKDTISKYENDEELPGLTYLLSISAACSIQKKQINALSKFDDDNKESGKSRELRYQMILLRILRSKLDGTPIFNEEEAEKYRGK